MIKENVEIKEIEAVMSEIYQSLEYIKDYGYVGCYDITPEEVKKKSAQALESLKIANDWLEDIGEGIKNSFEY